MKGAKAGQIHDLKLETRREFLKKDDNLESAFTANAVSQNNKGRLCKQQRKAVKGYCNDIACMRAAKVEEDAQTALCNPICDSSGPGHSEVYGL